MLPLQFLSYCNFASIEETMQLQETLMICAYCLLLYNTISTGAGKVWCRSIETKLKPDYARLWNICFLMDPFNLDELCKWVRTFSDKDFNIDA